MKRFLVFILGIVLSLSAMAQQWVEVVYLKNGSIIRGTVIEQSIGENNKIQTADGSIFVYPMSDVEKITKEQRAVTSSTRVQGSNVPYQTEGNNLLDLSGKLDYLGHGDFSIGGLQIESSEQLEAILKPGGYLDTFVSANRQRITGNILLPVGGEFLVMGMVFGILAGVNMPTTLTWTHYEDSAGRSWDTDYHLDGDYETYREMSILCAISTSIGATAMGVGIVLKIIGRSRLNWIADDYNEQHGYAANLVVGPTATGFGLALKF